MLSDSQFKILWVSEVEPDPNSGAGGTELQMVQQLRALGHEIQTIWATDLPRMIQHGNLHYALELPRTYSSAILRACKKTTFDIVTVNLGQSYLAAKRLRRQGFTGAFIVRSHGLDDHLDGVLLDWQRRLNLQQRPLWRRVLGRLLINTLNGHIRKAAHFCDGYVVSNSLDARFLEKRHKLNKSKVACIPQAPSDTFKVAPVKKMTESRMRRLLYVAGFHYVKGPHAASSAANKLLRENKNLSLTWVCHVNDHEKVRRLLDPECLERTRLMGWVSQEELVKVFDKHGVFIYPSLFDGFGKVFIEAMSRGLCVIGTRTGGMVDIIRHGENGYLCDFNNAEQIVEVVQCLHESFYLANQVSACAALTAKNHTWERVGIELSKFFQRCLNAKTFVSESESVPSGKGRDL